MLKSNLTIHRAVSNMALYNRLVMLTGWILTFLDSVGGRGRRGAQSGTGRTILVIRTDEIGDIVLTIPLLREIRKSIPGVRLIMIVKPSNVSLFEACPYVDRVLAFDPDCRRPIMIRRFWRALRLAMMELRSQKIDVVVLPRLDADLSGARWLAYLSGAPVRIGYSETIVSFARSENAGQDVFLTSALRPSDGVRHEVERNLALSGCLGFAATSSILEFWNTPADEQFAAQHIGGKPDSGAWIALCPDARHKKKVWPLELYVRMGRSLRSSRKVRIVLLGARNGNFPADLLSRELDALDLTGRTTIPQAYGILRRCDLYLGSDTGLMHLAAAAGIPIVAIFCHPRNGSPSHINSPERFGPWSRKPFVICRPERSKPPCIDFCQGPAAHCICDVPVAAVCEAAVGLLSDSHIPVPAGDSSSCREK